MRTKTEAMRQKKEPRRKAFTNTMATMNASTTGKLTNTRKEEGSQGKQGAQSTRDAVRSEGCTSTFQ